MKFISQAARAVYGLGVALLLGSCHQDTPTPNTGTGTVSFDISHFVGNAPLELGSGSYVNAAGQRFSVSKFNYLLTDFRLRRADGSSYAVPGGDFLITENQGNNPLASGTNFTLENVPVGDYTGLTFTVGVDSARNVSGAQPGALAATNQMFWDWSQGYVFLKLEGSWAAPGQASSGFMYHVGGFSGSNNALRTVAPAWPTGTRLLVRPDHAPQVHLAVDVLQLLNGPTAANNLSFATLPMVHMAGAGAARIATNYSGSSSAKVVGISSMFVIDHIHAN